MLSKVTKHSFLISKSTSKYIGQQAQKHIFLKVVENRFDIRQLYSLFGPQLHLSFNSILILL